MGSRPGQATLFQQLPQQLGVGPVGLGPPLGAAQRPGVGRLGQMRTEPGTLQRLGDEPPPVVASNATSACWPVKRTAWRLLAKRRTSPNSAQIATAVSQPTP